MAIQARHPASDTVAIAGVGISDLYCGRFGEEVQQPPSTLVSLTEEFTVTRAREALLNRESKDPKVSQAGIEVRTGREHGLATKNFWDLW